jgi:hypothetical protein
MFDQEIRFLHPSHPRHPRLNFVLSSGIDYDHEHEHEHEQEQEQEQEHEYKSDSVYPTRAGVQ